MKTLAEFLAGPIRYSAFKDYSECPYKFASRYLAEKRFDNVNMAIGRTVEGIVNDALLGKVPTITLAGNNVRLHSEDGLVAYHPAKDILTMALHGLMALNELANTHKALPNPMLQRRLIAALNFDGHKIRLQVTPDFVWECQDGTILLADLKTCGSYSTWNEAKAMRDAQLNLYSAVISSLFKGAKVLAYYVCVNRTDFRTRTLPSASNPSEFMDKIYWAHQGMLAGRISECVTSWQCTMCELNGSCPQTINKVVDSSELPANDK